MYWKVEVESRLGVTGLKKSAAWWFRPGRFSCWVSNFSFPLARWTRDQACRLPWTKSLKELIKTCPGPAKFETTFPKSKLEFEFFGAVCEVHGKKVWERNRRGGGELGKIRRKLEGGMVWKLQRRKEKKVRQDREEEWEMEEERTHLAYHDTCTCSDFRN